MGQALVSPKPLAQCYEFVNLPTEAIESLWTSYNLNGEGWSMNIDELKAVFRGAEYIANNYSFTDEQLDGLFEVFDSDKNGLIDALELEVTLALISGTYTYPYMSMFCYCECFVTPLRVY